MASPLRRRGHSRLEDNPPQLSSRLPDPELREERVFLVVTDALRDEVAAVRGIERDPRCRVGEIAIERCPRSVRSRGILLLEAERVADTSVDLLVAEAAVV